MPRANCYGHDARLRQSHQWIPEAEVGWRKLDLIELATFHLTLTIFLALQYEFLSLPRPANPSIVVAFALYPGLEHAAVWHLYHLLRPVDLA